MPCARFVNTLVKLLSLVHFYLGIYLGFLATKHSDWRILAGPEVEIANPPHMRANRRPPRALSNSPEVWGMSAGVFANAPRPPMRRVVLFSTLPTLPPLRGLSQLPGSPTLATSFPRTSLIPDYGLSSPARSKGRKCSHSAG